MEINGKPRIVIWFVSNDGRFIVNAVNILTRQFKGVDIIGVTAAQQISIKDGAGKILPFIPLNELVQTGTGGGMTFSLLLVQKIYQCQIL